MMGSGEHLPSDADIRFFEDNGHWIGGKILSEAESSDLHRAMDDVYAGRFETGRPPHLGGWRDRGIAGEIRKTDNAYWANNTIGVCS